MDNPFKKLIHYSQKNINVNIINSFQIVKKDKRRNSYANLKNSLVRYYSFNKYQKNLKDKNYLQNKMIDKASFATRSFKPNSIQEYHNISLNFIPNINNKNPNKKEEINKIVFYSILLNDLYNKYISKNPTYFTNEELEEQKKTFLYQLYYCLGLSKIYILNFKESKFPKLNSEEILPLNNNNTNYKKNKNTINKNSSIFSENSGIRFKTFYETFSNYSQIKISSLERFDNKSYPNIEIVNQYYIFKDKQIGKGGSSVVYLGEDDEKQNTFAIKIT